MDVESQDGGYPHARPWADLVRDRYRDLWNGLAGLTVLASMPGWGRSTWISQCRAHLHSQGIETLQLNSRNAVSAFLQAADTTPAITVFIDDVIMVDSDELWAELISVLAGQPRIRMVVSSLDYPPPEADTLDLRLLDERDLAMSPTEIEQLAAQVVPGAPADLTGSLAEQSRGCPVLVRRHLDRYRQAKEETTWINPSVPLEKSRLTDIFEARQGTLHQSSYLELFARATSFRRFGAAFFDGEDAALNERFRVQFTRLENSPLGVMETDDESGERLFEWKETTWRALESLTSDEQRRRGFTHALERTAASGHITMQLYYLLRLRLYDQAEELVFENLRLFLLTTPVPCYQELRNTLEELLSGYPNLVLLFTELKSRRRGEHIGSIALLSSGLKQLSRQQGTSGFDRFRILTRQTFAGVSLGDRAGTQHRLASIVEMLGTDERAGLIHLAANDDRIASALAAEAYLPFWAATQIDDHQSAEFMVTLMRDFASSESKTARAEILTARTQEVFLGTADSQEGPVTGQAHADPLVLIEQGDDARALELISVHLHRRSSTLSRSTADAFILMIHALLSHAPLPRDEILETFDRSQRFWSDGHASTFVTAAASFALMARQDLPAAEKMLRRAHQQDWFTRVARTLLHLLLDDADAAMMELSQADELCGYPRAQAVAGVLGTLAHHRLGNAGAAKRHFHNLVRRVPAAHVRFALRFVPVEDYPAFEKLAELLDGESADVIGAAASDFRPLRSEPPLRLSPVELELLLLLRRGLSNTQIAAARVVSINTVRTQLRLMLRKLDVSNRQEAVARAEELGLFSAPESGR